MNYGIFFSLNREHSDLTNRIVVFNYRGIEISEWEKIGSTRYPIYVYISPYFINFEVHVSNNENDRSHTHFSLFRIPLDKGMISGGDFTDMLKRSYSALFNEDPDHKILQLLLKSYNSQKNKYKSYSTLQVFNKEQNEDKPFYLIRKIILDFLFDLDRSASVFDMSPNSVALLSKVCRNQLFNAIVKKARFYFSQEEYYINKQAVVRKTILPQFIQNAKDWNNFIRTGDNEYLFHSSGWCDDVESELVDMFRPVKDEKIDIPIKNNENWKEMWDLSINWLVKRFSFRNTLTMFFPSYKETPAKNIGKHGKMKFGLIFCQYFLVIFVSIFFLVNLYRFLILIPLAALVYWIIAIYKKKWHSALNLLLPRLWAIIMSTWIVLICNTEILKCFCDLELNWGNYCLQVLIILAIMFLFVVEIKKVNPFVTSRNKFLSSGWIITLGFVYSLVIGIALSSFASKKILGNTTYLKDFLNTAILERQSLDMDECYSYLGRTFINECLDPGKADQYMKRVERIINNDSLSIDSIIGKNPICSQEIKFEKLPNKWNNLLGSEVNHSRLMYIVCSDILSDTICYGISHYYEIPMQTFSDHDNRQCLSLFKKLMTYKLSANSYFDSLKYLKFSNNPVSTNLSVEKKLISGIYIRYFPAFLTIFSCISMFIGVFLQVIIEDKKITEAI